MDRRIFYHSKAWRNLSRIFLMSKNYICERCGQPAVISHHKTHLNAVNVVNPAISLNPELLEALCLNCHNTEHFSAGGVTAAGLLFDINGDIVPTERNDAL